jgi:hypothetical protein
MKKIVGLLALFGILTGILAGCGATPEPTEPPPTQTPWIVVITSTAIPTGVTEVLPTQTPQVVATPTVAKPPTSTPTKAASGAAPSPEVTPLSPTAAVGPTQTAAPRPTNTSEPLAYTHPAPVLLDPPMNRPVSWNSTVLLKWSSVGDLAADEYYYLHLDRPPMTAGMTYYGDYVFTKETEYRLEGSFLAPFHPPAGQGQAVVYWWVSVVRKTGEDQNGKPIGVDVSLPSGKWTLILDPKPEGK